MLTAAQIHGFSEAVLAKKYDERKPTPRCHIEWWELCCGPDPLVAIAAPRGHAKSTAITHAFVLASVLFKDRAFVLLVSDTYEQACMFLKDIKQELQENEDLIALFDVDPEFEKDSENDIIVRFKGSKRKFRIIAKGSEQKVRGTKWDGRRPDLIVCDDLENDEIVLNDERRRKFKQWFLNALLPARSDSGIIRIVGTILHMDSLLENIMPPLFDKQTVDEPLKSYSTRRAALATWKSIRYRAHDSDFSHILWEQKWTKERLLAERKKYIDMGNPEGYAQEYLNYPLDESRSYFRKSDFREMREEDYVKPKTLYVALDPAISEEERHDFSAFIVGGVDPDGVLHILEVVRDRLDSHGIVEWVFALQRKYEPDLFVIEKGAIEKSLGPYIYSEMLKPGRQPVNIVTKMPTKDKESRARSIQARMRAGGCRFDKKGDWYPEFELECLQFPRAKYDDQVDAFAWLGLTLAQMVEAPTLEEQEKANWEEDVRVFLHEGITGGRSAATGY